LNFQLRKSDKHKKRHAYLHNGILYSIVAIQNTSGKN
jgi:hypothetical protein